MVASDGKDLGQSGLDIDLGNACSKTAFGWAKRSFANRWNKLGMPCLEAEGSFSNLMDYGDLRIAMSSDGIGTKVELAERTGVYDSLGFDLVAMTCDDLVASGVEPVNLSNILDVDRLDHRVVDLLMKGLHDAAKQAGIAVVGGEIAELGSRIGGWGPGMHFNWCATAIGVLPRSRDPIDGKKVAPGQAIVSIRSRGFRSNGFSLIRRIMQRHHGPQWHKAMADDRRSWGEVLLSPSLVYSPLVTGLLRDGCPITGVVHVTGGGLADNLSRVLSGNGLGAHLDDIHEPQSFVRALQVLGDVPEEQAYQLWNMGNGMLLIMPERQVAKACKFAARKGFMARPCGRVTDTRHVVIETAGCHPTEIVHEY
jgi:phosphoribosylformylglycinamidine cyclo-ligase